ncbi:class I SAM-dependent methyltransferase [Streptomyces sp. NPDC014734]|uniref:class I SAM-dependent methyltransferase n=1 Tax=Streptomyces sp. NPDC014734 TaxID=3364886 RepID=UPI0036F9F980
MKGGPAVAGVSKSLWATTSDVDYMRQNGRAEHTSHQELTDRLIRLYSDTEYELLDCGIMSGVTYEMLRNSQPAVRYTGIDIGAPVIEDCRSKFGDARWYQMSITDVAFPDASFDVVNCRHVLEHLPYYETAVRELFRISRRHVAICFFQPPREPEVLLRRETANGYIWLNRYAPAAFERLLNSLSSMVESVDLVHGHSANRIYFCTK